MAIVATNPAGGCVQWGELLTCTVQATMSLI